MMRAWIGVALLAVSWLLGQTYYFPAAQLAWVVVVVAGALLLGGVIDRLPQGRAVTVALLLMIPAACFAPWPLRTAPLLMCTGLLLELLPIPRRWSKPVARGAVVAGAVMLAQALILAAYAAQTARNHDLPRPLPELLAGLANLLGIDASADGSEVVMHSLRQVHRLAATWELLIDPVTLGFFAGSLVLAGLIAWDRLPQGRRWKAWIGALRSLTLILLVWLPIRAGLLMALYLQRVLRADYELPLHAMNMFFSPWVLLLLAAVPVLLAWRFVSLPQREAPQGVETPDQLPLEASAAWSYPAAVALIALAVAVFTVAIDWDPVGRRQQGRVMVVERHSTWEPTTQPYDTTRYGELASYNYAAVYEYLGQHYEMSRLLESEKIDLPTLSKCDVLVIKIPTARYADEEVKAVLQFVEQGGALLLIGDHTNVFKSSVYLNDLTRHMGFTFRHDLLFGTGESPYEQLYTAPWVAHPAVQHLPPMDFAVSCSIDPGRSSGRAVIAEAGLWSMPPNYHPDNYHPVPQYVPEMRYGPFIQLWSTRYGKGRVLAFTDSTIFSNFCTFQPGKAELLLGMVEWLNHRGMGNPRLWLLLVGIVPLGFGLWLSGGRRDAWLVILASGTCAWMAASLGVAAVSRSAMPMPEIVRPLKRVVIDRTTSEAPLSKGADVQGGGGVGYGLFEQWIPRLGGNYTVRLSGPQAFSGHALVVICPNRSVSHEFRRGLIEYVRGGGKLLVIDSPENNGSTANSLLSPFGLSFVPAQAWQGTLQIVDDWPGVRVTHAREVSGGRAIARLGTQTVAAVAPAEKTGKGWVTAIGFGSHFNDANLGHPDVEASWMLEPDAEKLQRFDVLFALVRAAIEGREVEIPAEREGTAAEPAE